ncbi:MAG: hypothetical protein ACK52S_03370 [Pirellula sp.]
MSQSLPPEPKPGSSNRSLPASDARPNSPAPSPSTAANSLEEVLERINRLADQAGGGSNARPPAIPSPAAHHSSATANKSPLNHAESLHPTSPKPANSPNLSSASTSAPPTPSSPLGSNMSAPGSNVSGPGPNQLPPSLFAKQILEDDSLFKWTNEPSEPIVPLEPNSLEQAGVSANMVEEIVMRFLLNRGESPGRNIADQIRLPFRLIEPVLYRLKMQQLTVYLGSTAMNDYIHGLTDAGRERARRHLQKSTYFGAAPVPLEQYIQSVKLQSVEQQHPNGEDLKRAFSDLLVPPHLLAKLGPAINSGRGMFLYGYPGNGKTSIAERVTRAFGQYIWIPRAILVDGDLLRLYDPLNHEEHPLSESDGPLQNSTIDRRWIRVKRPTIVAGGELTMSMLEISRNPETNISEAPLQLKSNCGVLLIDDFGRQRMSVDELLNRWIVPLEKRHDYLSISSGKKVQVPFDQLVIFSTNLEPKDLVDDAFLRRIPYKIEVPNPTEEAFRKLFEIMCRSLKIPHRQEAIDYLITQHYKPYDRPFRNCHPRDLLLQVRSFCLFNSIQPELTRANLDFAVENYFSIM